MGQLARILIEAIRAMESERRSHFIILGHKGFLGAVEQSLGIDSGAACRTAKAARILEALIPEIAECLTLKVEGTFYNASVQESPHVAQGKFLLVETEIIDGKSILVNYEAQIKLQEDLNQAERDIIFPPGLTAQQRAKIISDNMTSRGLGGSKEG